MHPQDILQRAPGITTRTMAGALFIADSKYEAVYRMNTTSAALWRLLDEPMSIAKVIGVFSTAFPEIPSMQLEHDLHVHIRDLLKDEILQLHAE